MLIHIVKRGDTLWKIANQYNTTVNNIQQINELPNPDQLLLGQALVIPTPISSHVVKSGESLWSIAREYGVTINSILQINSIPNSNILQVGQVLYIPPITHIIQPGQTLTQIANIYGVTIQSIIDENRIQNPNLLYPGTQLIIPRPKKTIEVNAYSYQSDAQGAESVNAIGHLLTYLSPFAYMIREDGSLQPFTDELMLRASVARNVTPIMSITNFTSTEQGSNLAHVILSSPELSEKVIDNTLKIMMEKGYKGVNFDFEYVLPEDRENYNRFLQLAVDKLHDFGFIVTTAVAPKTSSTQTGLLYTAHDYEAHGRIVDFVFLMTYEWGWRGGPPTAISPINKMREVVDYALTVIPREKIFLGFQIYARDWKVPHQAGQTAETFSPQEAIRRATNFGANIQYDETAQSPYFRYVDSNGQVHEVWFEDARSALAKFNLAKEKNLRGISYWALGYPFPQNWTLLANQFSIKKL